jgi:hypothetical protein
MVKTRSVYPVFPSSMLAPEIEIVGSELSLELEGHPVSPKTATIASRKIEK